MPIAVYILLNSKEYNFLGRMLKIEHTADKGIIKIGCKYLYLSSKRRKDE
jgi:hypothetical protein